MVEKMEMVGQAIARLKGVLEVLDTDASLAGASVHVQWAIDLLSDHSLSLRIAPRITTLIVVDGN
jgi:hypothetical protein